MSTSGDSSGKDKQGAHAPRSPRESAAFPLVTVGLSLGTLFLFLGLMYGVTTRTNRPVAPTPLDASAEPKPDAAAKLDELKTRNDAALGGVGAKMSRDEARAKLLATLKSPNDAMPFPRPEPTQPDAKKDAEGKP